MLFVAFPLLLLVFSVSLIFDILITACLGVLLFGLSCMGFSALLGLG